MTLPGVVALAVILQALAAVLLVVASGEVQRSATSHRAMQAEAAWRTVVADGAGSARDLLGSLAPGEMRPLVMTAPAPDWTVVAAVLRAPVGAVGALRVSVVHRAGDGTPLAARHGTLILPLETADTAVIGPDGSGTP